MTLLPASCLATSFFYIYLCAAGSPFLSVPPLNRSYAIYDRTIGYPLRRWAIKEKKREGKRKGDKAEGKRARLFTRYRRLNNTGRLTRRNSRRMRYRVRYFSQSKKPKNQLDVERERTGEGGTGGSIEQLSEIELSFWHRLSRPPSRWLMAVDTSTEFLGINYGETTDDFAI